MPYRTSRRPGVSLLAVLAVLTGALLSCETKQEGETGAPPSSSIPSAVDRGTVELPEGSPILSRLKTDRVQVRQLRSTLAAQAGKILANENRLAHLGARVPGRIVSVYANLGDHVKENDRLLLLDSPAFGEAQLEYRKARTILAVAEQSRARAKALVDRGAIGAGEYQRRDADYQNARADLHEAEEKLHLLGMTEREIRRLASKDLPHAEVAQVSLRAPFPGEIIERDATVGEVVDPNHILFTVADLSTVWVRADFPEQQAARLRTGLPIEVRVAAYPTRVFSGTITHVGAVIDPATRTVMARAEVPNPDRALRPEMFADITLVAEEQPTVSVPRTALQQVGSRRVVFVVREPRRYEAREVSLGASSGEYVGVLAGVSEGETVVTDGSYSLKSEMLREQMSTEGPL